MRITKDYGLTTSKLEHDLLARLNKVYKPVKKTVKHEPRRYTHIWKRGLIKLMYDVIGFDEKSFKPFPCEAAKEQYYRYVEAIIKGGYND